MPEVTIVASWRLATARSLGLTRANSSRLTSRERYLCAMSTTTRPRSLSCSATSCFESASTSPRAGTPDRSIALNTNVAIGYLAPTAWAAAGSCPLPWPPISRRSSSTECARDSASWRVIVPWRVSCASAESIVCIPWTAPVCSTE